MKVSDMRVAHSHKASKRERSGIVLESFRKVSTEYLATVVETISVPRHAIAEPGTNVRVAFWIMSELDSFGYRVEFQGEFRNVVALPSNTSGPYLLVGAHYDSVPGCPGADDNASAVAVMLMCAKAVSGLSYPIGFVAFNREEDGFLGSADFVQACSSGGTTEIEGCHVLEMVGYSTDEPESQKLPPGLPIKIPSTGNFLGVLGNRNSAQFVDDILSVGKSYLPDLHVIGLKLYLGLERLLPDLTRSDHVSFWNQGIPATMWTDTADFRNPNYHRRTDTPDTLNYEFMANVTKLLIASILAGRS
jgi:Zn-dependent M28 family amino/carboxypeptidase